MARTFGQNQPVLLEKPEEGVGKPASPAPRLRPSRFGNVAFAVAAALSLFWVGICAAFLWGYWGPQGLASLNLQTVAMILAVALLPPFLLAALAVSLARGAAMQDAARQMLLASD